MQMRSDHRGISRRNMAIAVVLLLLLVAAGVYLAFGSTSGIKSSTTGTETNPLSFTDPLSIKSGGSTFVNPIMQSWIAIWARMTDGQVSDDYEALGSGNGINGIFAGIYDFAGSDAPVPPLDIRVNGTGRTLLQIPEALGSVGILYNIPGIPKTATLNLTGKVLEEIYTQNITKWNDPQVQSINKGITLPDATIICVHRSDGSGTTYALTNYLADVVPSFAQKVGVGVIVNWPNSPDPELSDKGSGAVALIVNETDYSIGYADSFYAFANGIKTAAIENSAGHFLKPSLDGAAAAAAAFGSQVEANATFPIMNAPGATSYPIATYTYLLVWADQPTAQKAEFLTKFFWWIVNQGQTYASGLFYSPLPASIVSADEAIIRQINNNGSTYAPTS